jgi:predicted DNA binding CopG/RHH family protein
MKKRIVLEVSEQDHKAIKIAAAELGIPVREYVLKAIADKMKKVSN